MLKYFTQLALKQTIVVMLNKLQHMQQCASINSERPQAVLGSYSSATLLERNVSGKHNGRQTR